MIRQHLCSVYSANCLQLTALNDGMSGLAVDAAMIRWSLEIIPQRIKFNALAPTRINLRGDYLFIEV